MCYSIDRLTIHQQMLLKVASLIGDAFDIRVAIKYFPLSGTDEEHLSDAADVLAGYGLIKKVPDVLAFDVLMRNKSVLDSVDEETKEAKTESLTVPGLPSSKDNSRRNSTAMFFHNEDFTYDVHESEYQHIYQFSNFFLRSLILSRLLVSHKTQLLNDSLNTHSDLVEEEVGESIVHEKLYPESILEGWLAKKGGKIKTSHQRYFILNCHELRFYKNANTASMKGVIKIAPGMKASYHKTEPNRFFLTPEADAREFEMITRSQEQAARWVIEINKVLTMSKSRKSALISASARKASIAYGNSTDFAAVLADYEDETEPVFFQSVREGYLLKSGGSIKTWKNRYFVLFHDKMQYFHSKSTTNSVTGEIPLNRDAVVQAEVAVDNPGMFSVTPIPGGRKYMIAAASGEGAHNWISDITDLIKLARLRVETDSEMTKIAIHSQLEGWMRKRKITNKLFVRWETRYVVLYANKLEWYSASLQDSKNLEIHGSVNLHKDTEVTVRGRIFTVLPAADQQGYDVEASTAEMAEKWAGVIRKCAATQLHS